MTKPVRKVSHQLLPDLPWGAGSRLAIIVYGRGGWWGLLFEREVASWAPSHCFGNVHCC